MSNPNIRDLLMIQGIAHDAANHGETVSLTEAKDAMAERETTDLLEQFDEMEAFEMYDDDTLAKLNDYISYKHIYDEERMGVVDNGLRLIAENIVSMIGRETFKSTNTGEEVRARELELIQDWR